MSNYKPAIATAVTVIALALGGAAANDAAAQSKSDQVPMLNYEESLVKFQFDADKFVGQRFTGECPPVSSGHKVADLKGTDVYPSDASICGAALHAGVIDQEGGVVTVQLNPGVENYIGSSRNGVETASLPGTPRSIVFIGEEPSPAVHEVFVEKAPRLDWKKKFTATGFANKKLLGQQFTFNCNPAPRNLKPRRIVGTDLYAFNSVICVAAVHAGKISMDGGLVTVQLEPGEKKLAGSIRNGIESKGGSGGHTTISFVDTPPAPVAQN